jgi:hypothetical protein
VDNWNRRGFLVRAAGGILLPPLLESSAQGTTAGRKTASPIRAVRVGSPIAIPDNLGDTWIAAWADDDNLYTPSNDSVGFHLAAHISDVIPTLTPEERNILLALLLANDRDGLRKTFSNKQIFSILDNIAFNRLEGRDPANLQGVTVNHMADFSQQDHIKDGGARYWGLIGADGRTWKSSGCASIDGILYWVVARHNYGEISDDPQGRQTAANATILKSTDFGKTWSPGNQVALERPMFPGTGFATPYFIDYGKARRVVDGSDRYVYAISNNGFWDNGDRLILGRVRRDRIGHLNAADWEFFAKGRGSMDPHWTPHVREAAPILEKPSQLGMTGASFLADQNRYVMIGWYLPIGGMAKKDALTACVWDFYEAPRPWGPWKQVYSYTWKPSGYYCPAICPKFQSPERIYVFTAGSGTDVNGSTYCLTAVPIELS